ncbi:MAG: putative tryptophan/tyrosine transport system substrate-binding protein [Candidatus Dependentiae bacterium]|nr:putative tryptophan/tyrosine transport system substrate-binding protein [Candidatus Dependentiae bacterium]
MIRSKECRVGILTVQGRPYHMLMTNYLIDQINNGVQGVYKHKLYRLNSMEDEHIQMRARSIIQSGEVDLLITIGARCSISTKKVADEMGDFPQIFIGVSDSVEQGLIDCFEKPGSNITGVVFEEASVLELARYVAYYYPTVKRILIPYSSTPKSKVIMRHAGEIAQYLSSAGMEAFSVSIGYDYGELMGTIKEYGDKVDGILLLDGCYSSIAQDEISYLCWEKLLVLIGSNIASIDAGASGAYSGDINQLAVETYKKLRMFWEKNIPLGIMPIKVLKDNRQFTVNVDALRKIGFPDEALLKLCSSPKVKVVRKWVHPPKKLL